MTAPGRAGRVQLLLVGDSLTQYGWDGWAASLASWYQRKGDVTNRGFSGFTSRWLVSMIDGILEEMVWCPMGKRNIMTIFLGANDSSTGENGFRCVPIEEFEMNIQTLIDKGRASCPDVHVVLITPPRVDASQWDGRSDEQVQVYAECIRNLAAKNTCLLVDLWEDLPKSPSIVSSDLYDGLHFGPSGHEKLYVRLNKVIREDIPELDPTWHDDGSCAIEQHYPDWRLFVGKSEKDIADLFKEWRWAHL